MKGTMTRLRGKISLGIRAKLSIVTAFFVTGIIFSVSIISLGQQYRSLTDSQERELRPIRSLVERIVLDLENISNTMQLIEDFRIRIREKGRELSRYRRQSSEEVKKETKFGAWMRTQAENIRKDLIEKGTLKEEKARELDEKLRKMVAGSSLLKKILIESESTRVVYRDTYFSEYLNERKIREIEDSVRALLRDQTGDAIGEGQFRRIGGFAAQAVDREREFRKITAELKAAEARDSAADGAEVAGLRKRLLEIAAAREQNLSGLNEEIMSCSYRSQKKLLRALGMNTGDIRIQLYTARDSRPGFDTRNFSDRRGINAAGFFDDPLVRRDWKKRGRVTEDPAGAWEDPAAVESAGRRYDVTLRPVFRNPEVAFRAHAVIRQMARDPESWRVLCENDARYSGEIRIIAKKLRDRIALLRRNAVTRPADDPPFRALYGEYSAVLKKRGERMRELAAKTRARSGGLFSWIRTGGSPQARYTADAFINLRETALYDFGILRARADPGRYEEFFESRDAADEARERWRALRGWIMSGESETVIPPFVIRGKSLPVIEDGVMSRSRSELEEEMWRLDSTPLYRAGKKPDVHGLARELYASSIAGLTRTIVDVTESRARIWAGMRIILYAAGALGLAAVALSLFMSTVIVRDIETISAKAALVGNGDLTVTFGVDRRDEIGALSGTLNAMVRGLVERERAKKALGRFVSTQVAELALASDLKLGGERKECAVLFNDIRGFTSLSEQMTPEEIMEFLNEYLSMIVGCVDRTDGVVDKFIGDAIMATWGAVYSGGDDAANAVNAALMMRAAVARYNAGRAAAGRVPVRTGCGLSYGPVIAGQVGTEERLEYTVIGDTVNLASRIESLTKEFGCDILISQGMRDRVKDMFRLVMIQDIKVKGKNEPQTIHAVLGRLDDPSAPKSLEELRALIS